MRLGWVRSAYFGTKTVGAWTRVTRAGRVPSRRHGAQTGCWLYFFYRCARHPPPTRPPAVPSRASMKKNKEWMLPPGHIWRHMANIRPVHGQKWTKQNKKLANCWPYIRTIYGHIYGLCTPDIPCIYGLLLVQLGDGIYTTHSLTIDPAL